MTLGFKVETSQAVEPTKTKRISNEEELRELEKLQIEVGTKPLRYSSRSNSSMKRN